MKLLKSSALACTSLSASLLLTVFTADHSQAAITITGQQVGADFVFSYTGSIDLSGTTLSFTGGSFASSFVGSSAASGIYNVIGTGLYTAYIDTFVSQPDNFGIDTLQILANSEFGDLFFVQGAGFGDAFGVPDGYASGTAISGSATYNNSTITSLGLTPGSYIWELSNGDTITQNIVNPVPEPLTMLGAGAAIAFGSAFKRRKA